MPVQPIPSGYHTVTPYLLVPDVAKLIEFLRNAFDAVEVAKTTMPDGHISHAEIRLGDSMIMAGAARGEHPARPMSFYLYVKDVDAVYQQAVRAGGVSTGEPTNHFYGDRSGGIRDEFGNDWWIGTHIEDVSPEEIARRAAALGR